MVVRLIFGKGFPAKWILLCLFIFNCLLLCSSASGRGVKAKGSSGKGASLKSVFNHGDIGLRVASFLDRSDLVSLRSSAKVFNQQFVGKGYGAEVVRAEGGDSSEVSSAEPKRKRLQVSPESSSLPSMLFGGGSTLPIAQKIVTSLLAHGSPATVDALRLVNKKSFETLSDLKTRNEGEFYQELVHEYGEPSVSRVIEGKDENEGYVSEGNENTVEENDFGVPKNTLDIEMFCPVGLAICGNSLYIADSQANTVSKVNLNTGVAERVVGTGELGDKLGEKSLETELSEPEGVVVSPDGRELYIADSRNNRVLMVNLETGDIKVVVGTGELGDKLGKTALETQLSCPLGLAICRDDLYVTDADNNRVLKFDRKTDAVKVVLGTGQVGKKLDTYAIDTELNFPGGVVVSPNGKNLYIADRDNHRVLSVDLEAGKVQVVVGTGERGKQLGETALETQLSAPVSLALSKGKLYLADEGNARVLMVNLETGDIKVVVGTGEVGNKLSNDALKTELSHPNGIVVSPNGRFYLSDSENARVLEVIKVFVKYLR